MLICILNRISYFEKLEVCSGRRVHGVEVMIVSGNEQDSLCVTQLHYINDYTMKFIIFSHI